jgi:quercetin dioxygenase-like cupin family protein
MFSVTMNRPKNVQPAAIKALSADPRQGCYPAGIAVKLETQKEDQMNKIGMLAFTGAAAVLMFAASSQGTETGFQPKPYFQMPLEKDPSRVVRLQNVTLLPGAGNSFHRHPGDQWWAIQEGEVTFTIKGKAPRVLKAGDYVYVPRGTVHRNQNLSNRPARAIELNITDKDKPPTEQVPD